MKKVSLPTVRFYFTYIGFIFTFLLLFTVHNLKAQDPNEEVNSVKPNLKLIEHLIKQKVDSVRKNNALPAFLNDTILYLSSRNHAKYLTKEIKLSHYQQGSRARRSYHERAVKFGAEDYYVSENIAQAEIYKSDNKEEGTVTYSQLANKIFEQWDVSIGCMVNILAPSHIITGIATWYEPEKAEIRVAASFAAVTRSYKPRHYPGMFPYAKQSELENYKNLIPKEKPPRKYQWGIGSTPDSKVMDKYRRYKRLINTISFIQDNDSIFVVFNNPRAMQKLFEDQNDGLAIELVTKDLYRCERIGKDPMRGEEEFTVKGELLNPVYRNDLLVGITDVKRKPKLLVKPIGLIPKQYASNEYILNLVVLKNNRIADIITLNQAPAKVFDLALSLPPAQDSLPNPEYYIPHMRRDTLKLRVFFDQNKADMNTKVGDSISNWVEDKRIQRAAVYSYASIEGTEEINKDLTERRANETMTYFDTRDGRNVPIVKVTQENWHQFFQDIKQSKQQFLYNLDSAQVRSYVNQKLHSRELEPILARHRYVDLKILAYKIVNDVSIDGLALTEYMNLFNSMKLECSKQPEPCIASVPLATRIELVQLFLFNRNTKGRISWNEIDKLPIGLYSSDFDIHSEPLAKLHYNKLRFRLSHYGNTFTRVDSLKTLRELNKSPYPDPVIAYNYFVLMLNERSSLDEPEQFYKQNKLNELQNLISIIEGSDFDQSTVSRLKLYYHFKNAEQEYFMNRLGEYSESVQNSLDYIIDYFKNNPPDQGTANNLAMFFSAFRNFDAALQILEPYAFDNPNRSSFILYLKIFYANPRVKQNTDFYQFLKDAGDALSSEEWCALFEGEYPINFQVLDHEPLQMMYCKMCGE